MSYMFSYYGIACSITISVINYIRLGFELPVDGYYMHSYPLGEKPLIKSFLINVMWIPYFFFFGGLSIPVSQAIIAHLFSHNISWGAKKEVERSIFFEDIPKILKRFWVPWTICIVLTAGLIILSTSLVPVQWHIDGSAWAVILLLSILIGLQWKEACALHHALAGIAVLTYAHGAGHPTFRQQW
ncbi:uncharacterized protein B0H18DRAFT_962551 [Fomitopsis serialis]|uniref:uncharacterized protein n=1 Tax=Fomitopsis serialis TaxID=139415 RepID=UPI0020087B96|nr:uncharacterized protein B0H18DRAFT_962551 [Neoantrodia serialis]KAH9911074.1 hypothetical protein B0H18DRAFT_962551 [Neoantrodia serialis]